MKLTPLKVRMYNSHHWMSRSISGLRNILWWGKEFEWIFSEERSREIKTLENLTHLATQISLPHKDCRPLLVQVVLFCQLCRMSRSSATFSTGTVFSMVMLSKVTPKYVMLVAGGEALSAASFRPSSDSN